MINLELVNPKSIVIIGGSNNIEKPGGKVLKNILDHSFKGDLFVINPKNDKVQGIKSYKNLSELPKIDLAIFSIPAKFINNSVKELIENHSTKAFIVLSAGFSEVSEEGKKLEQELIEIVTTNNVSLIGPNCMGVLTPSYSGSFGGPIPKLDKNGVDFASGSGATAAFILENGITMGLKFASMFSVGNSATVGVEDIVEYWDETFDINTSSKSKLLYLEKVDNPKKLLKHSSSLIRKGCKIAAIKAGSSEAGSRAASSHTGALSSSDDAVDTLFKKAGIVRCYSREELVYAGAIFQYQELVGDKIAIITHAGGPGVMLADSLSKNGLKVPTITNKEGKKLLEKLYDGSSISNPIDFLATGTAKQLSDIIDFVNEDLDNIDAMVVIFGSPGLFDVKDVYDILFDKIKDSRKPIYPILPSIVTAKDEVEYFISKGGINLPDEVFFANILGRIYNTPKPKLINNNLNISKTELIQKAIDNNKNQYISPKDAGVFLDCAKIERIEEFIIKSKDKILELKNNLMYPLAMKVIGPLHKTDVGGVKLNIDKDSIISTYDELMQIKDAKGVLIQPMVTGLELFIGVKKEKNFGHIIFAGLGGIFIEVLKDVSKRLAPISRDDAFSMLRELKSYKLLEGVRGQKGIDIDKFADTIIKVSNLVTLIPEIEEMDINPLIATEKNLNAVDFRIKLEK